MIFPFLISNSGYIENNEIFQTDEILRSYRSFSSYMSLEVMCDYQIASPMPYILSFWSTL